MSSSMTVVGLGCELDRLFAGQQPALPMPSPTRREDLRDLFDALSGPIRRRDAVLVIVGDWLPPETLERLQTVHSLIQSDRIAIHITELPPLAASVLAALAAALAPRAACPGALASAIDAIAERLTVLAWAGSVAGLRHSGVSLGHHARSVLPWTSFGIGLQPDPFVEALTRNTEDAPLGEPEYPVDLLIAPADKAELSWITDVVAPALGGAAVRELPPTMHGSAWWGTSQLVEAVGVPTSLDWLAEVTLPTQLTRCAWCDEPIAVSPCPFCGDATYAAPEPATGEAHADNLNNGGGAAHLERGAQ